MNKLASTNEQLHNFIDDLEKCLNYEFECEIECDKIVLCGMGGSAISGNIVADYYLEISKIPIITMMNASLPKWVDDRTLTIVSSYSGNTLETLETYRQSLEIGCKRIVITAGGLLKELANKNNDTLILLPENLHPRHSIGYMIGYILGILRSVNSLEPPNDILESIESLKKYREELEDRENGIAIELARYYIDNIPVICSYNKIQSIIFRWKTQFNENSKYVAFCTTVSDFVYSDLKGWVNGRRPNYSLTVIVDDDNRIDDYFHTSKLITYLNDHNVKYKLVSLDGKTNAENMLRALMLGDYISMYMAQIQNIDPAGVPPISSLKKKLKPIIEKKTEKMLSIFPK